MGDYMNSVEIAEVVAQLLAGGGNGQSDYVGFGEYYAHCRYRHLGCTGAYSVTDKLMGLDASMKHDPCCPIYKAETFCRDHGVEIPKLAPFKPGCHSHTLPAHNHTLSIHNG